MCLLSRESDSFLALLRLTSFGTTCVVAEVLFLQRHGQSIGDLGQSLYAEEWPYWSVKKGNGVLEWGLDPPLTSMSVWSIFRALERPARAEA